MAQLIEQYRYKMSYFPFIISLFLLWAILFQNIQLRGCIYINELTIDNASSQDYSSFEVLVLYVTAFILIFSSSNYQMTVFIRDI